MTVGSGAAFVVIDIVALMVLCAVFGNFQVLAWGDVFPIRLSPLVSILCADYLVVNFVVTIYVVVVGR